MNILVLVQIFDTPMESGSDRNYFFYKKFCEYGFDVNVITSNIDYKSASPRFPNNNSNLKKNIKGISVEYLNVYTNIRGSFFRRTIFYLSYFFKALKLIIKKKDVDLIYAVSTPLSTGFLGVLASKILKAPLVFEVTDVWPDAAIYSGVLKNKFLIYFLKFFEKICYKNSNKIIALTEGIANNIQDKIRDKKKVLLISNGVDVELFDQISENSRENIRKKYDINSKIVCTYLGAHGRYNSLNTVLKAANILKSNHKFKFILIGDGDEKIKLKEKSKKYNLKNIIFLDPIPRSKSLEFLNGSDIFLLPNLKGDFFDGNLPNKLFDYMAAARPIIVSGSRESSELVKKADCGVCVEAENEEAIARNILSLGKMSFEERFEIGRKGSEYVKLHFNREKHSKLLIDIIMGIKKN
ncbi:glycosyltransferase family 4 protein [SAR86 cluster bacterium]|nr:glycosyltransferase family 4 protein [SAR86 cluster bacterium]